MTPFLTHSLRKRRELRERGREGRYMCHANIPLGSHDIAVKGEREEEWTINPTRKKGEVEGWTKVSKHYNVGSFLQKLSKDMVRIP